jgi:hypothetical protein
VGNSAGVIHQNPQLGILMALLAVSVVPLYYKNASGQLIFSHNEKNVRVRIDVRPQFSSLWLSAAKILYAHQYEGFNLVNGATLSPGTAFSRNSTDHTGTGPWYNASGTTILSTAPHLHLELASTYSNFNSTVLPLTVGTTYSAGTAVYRSEYKYQAWPLKTILNYETDLGINDYNLDVKK